MKQVIQRRGAVTVEEFPVPAVPPGFVLVRTLASVLSAGTERAVAQAAGKPLVQRALEQPDLIRQLLQRVAADGLGHTIDAVRQRLGEPVPLGYSAAGTVIAAASDASMFTPGMLVACAGAGFANHAEVLCVPRHLCAPVPAGVSAEDASFATIGAIALHGVRLARAEVASTVAVIGLGLLGQLASQILNASGCRVIGVDLTADRIDLARRLGADHATTPEQAEELVRSVTAGIGVDAVVITADTASDDPITLAGALARDRGTVVAVGAVGLNVPRPQYYLKELTLLVSRSYGPGRYDPDYELGGRDYPIGYVRWTEHRNLGAFLDLIARGRVRVAPLVTHRVPLTSASRAYEIITGKTDEPFLGVLLTYPDAPEMAQTITSARKPAEAPPAKARAPRVGVLGTGNFAKAVLLPAMKAAGTRMGGIVSRQGLNAKVCGERFGFEYFGTDEARIFSDADVDLVVIATRHDSHAPLALAAAAAGKDVFVEKPLCVTSEELDEVERVFSTPGSPRLMVGFNRRFAPLAEKLKAHFANAGAPLMVNYRVNAGAVPADHWTRDPKAGGGRIVGEACHFVDFIGWLVDAVPLTVSAQSLGPDDSSDSMAITITYADGSIGTLTYATGGDPAQGKERIEVHGAGRSAVLVDFRRLELFSNKRSRIERHRFGQDKGHKGEWTALVRALVDGEASPIPLEQILATTRITFLALESARTGTTLRLQP